MTFLEAMIVSLTRETTSGSTCRIGNASITVKYCKDIWEWEYQGHTFWDVHDLAEAIIEECLAFPKKLPYTSKMARTVRDALEEEFSPDEFFFEPLERPWGQAL
jgi:hypothetical protein